MNPEIERRLRRFGRTVDAAADAAVARAAHRPEQAPTPAGADVTGLDPVIGLTQRPSRVYRVLALAAATVAIVAAAVVVLARSSTPEQAGSGPDSTTPRAIVDSTDERVDETTTTSATTTTSTSTTSSTSTTTTSTPTTRPPVCPDYRANEQFPLRLCDTGEAVRQVQQRLHDTVDPSLGVDGYFGPDTRDAVREFQASQGLEVDGLVGPATWGALFPSAATTSSAPAGPAATA